MSVVRCLGSQCGGSDTFYVVNPQLDEAQARIESHLTFATRPQDAVLVVRRESGVGKTRLVYETISRVPGAQSLAVFAVDEDAANRLASLLANTSQSAIIVADEMTARGIARLRTTLAGHRHRVRVVAIESTEEEYRRDDGEAVWVNAVPAPTLEAILETNFPEVTRERRRAYAHLAEGTIRFAVELCRRDAEIQLERGLPRATFARDYVARLLANQERDAVEAIALFHGVGWRDEVADELQRLCTLLGLDVDRFRQAATRIGKAPGFIATAGRYWYVKPPIVAQVAFEDAWQRWGEHDVTRFLERIATSGLLQPFLRQVGRVAPDQVRRRVGDYWLDWARELEPERMRQCNDAERLLDLVEIDPALFLPILRQLIEGATDAALVISTDWNPARKEAKHELVKLARRFASLHEHFHDAEAILLRLARAEADPRVNPTAKSTYQQLFKVVLSGTVLPFADRLAVLRQRIREGDGPVSVLALDALCAIFDVHHSRGMDEPVVAGRIASDDWQPATYAEWHDCLVAAMAELEAVIATGSSAIRERIWADLMPRLGHLAEQGFAGDLGTLFPPEELTPVARERLVIELKTYLESLGDAPEETRRRSITTDDEQALRNLLDAVQPDSIQSRLAVILGVDYWQAKVFEGTSPWRTEVRMLADELIRIPTEWAIAIDQLTSPSSSNAYEFGLELGGRDIDGHLLDTVLDTALIRPLSNFTLGYVKGLTNRTTEHAGRIGQLLHDAEESAPLLAFYVAANAEKGPRALERMLRLVDTGRVPAAHLSTLARGLEERRLEDAEFAAVLARLATAADNNDADAATWGLRLLHLRLQDLPKVARLDDSSHGPLAEQTWRLVEATATAKQLGSGFWPEVFGTIAPADPERAAKVAADALGSGNVSLRPVASELLITLAETQPQHVIEQLGRVMLDPELAFSFTLHSHADVFAALPLTVIEEWLRASGSEGAIALAWHLPRPYSDADGRSMVPPLTELVLSRFGQEPEVVARLCQATISESRFEMEELYEGLAKRRSLAQEVAAFEAHPNAWVRAWARAVLQAVEDHERWVIDHQQESEERRLR